MVILRYVGQRLLYAIPALWLIVTMVFMLAHIVPGDPVAQMLGEGARVEDLQQLRHALGLDLPLWTQYRHYIAGVMRGKL
jgi:ABC-type dipeptide/oligopeptide/nickel transport system permease component